MLVHSLDQVDRQAQYSALTELVWDLSFLDHLAVPRLDLLALAVNELGRFTVELILIFFLYGLYFPGGDGTSNDVWRQQCLKLLDLLIDGLTPLPLDFVVREPSSGYSGFRQLFHA